MGERRGTKALELWCRRQTEGYPGVKVDNMTTSWRDGLAFCAMIHHFRPDLIEFEKLNKSDVYYNNELAFTTAEKYLGIPALLDADDMAAYEVPDRLSILTYLSQFYQVFAAQDSPNRLKRPSPAVEKSQITKTPGPPTKMAHVVGVPRRDPCQKCKLPVFLAERLTVGKKVYHRTCLKCARCGSQLTPGSFYETEVDDVYCCETCPDEEDIVADSDELATSSVLLRHAPNESVAVTTSAASTSSTAAAAGMTRATPVRSSIADRLAFFERSKAGSTAFVADSTLLEKSVSDEEKSKSLKRMETTGATATTSAATPAYKMNTAFSSFLNDTIDGEEPPEAEAPESEAATHSTADDGKTETQMEVSDSEDDEDDLSLDHAPPPALPKSPPPPEADAANKRFTATAQLQLVTAPEVVSAESPQIGDAPTSTKLETKGDEDNAAAKLATPEKKKSEIHFSLTTPTAAATTEEALTIPTTIDNANNNGYRDVKVESALKSPTINADPVDDDDEKESHKLTQKNVEINLELSQINVNDCVTKDKTADADSDTAAAHEFDGDREDDDNKNMQTIQSEQQKLESDSSTDMETATEEAEPEPVVELRAKPAERVEGEEDAVTTERLSVVRARLQQFEVIANNKNNMNININNDNNNPIATTNSTTTSPEKDNINASVKDVDNISDTESSASVTTLTDPTPTNSKQNASIEHDSVPEENLKNVEELKTMEVVSEPSQQEEKLNESLIEVPSNETETKDNANLAPKDVTDIELKPTQDDTMEIIATEDLIESKATQVDKIEITAAEDLIESKTTQVDDGEITAAEDLIESKVTQVDVGEVTAAKNLIESKTTQVDKMELTATEDLNASKVTQVNKMEITTTEDLNASKTTPSDKSNRTVQEDEYPEDLNPFASDDEDVEQVEIRGAQANKENLRLNVVTPKPRISIIAATPKTAEKSQLNPFDSSDDEVELEKSPRSSTAASTPSSGKVPPPRPPPPRISRNPFGDETDEDVNFSRRSSVSSSLTKKTPVPTPRTNISQSQNPTPEPTPRLSTKTPQTQNSSDYYGSANSLSTTHSATTTPHSLYRNSDIRGSNNSLTSSAGGTIRSRKQRKAPAPPPPSVKELFPSTETIDSSKASTPSSSTVGTPKFGRKKRPAPAPPKPARLDPQLTSVILEHETVTVAASKNWLNYPLQSELDSKLSDEEKALLEGKALLRRNHEQNDDGGIMTHARSLRRLIPLDASLLEDEDGNTIPISAVDEAAQCDDLKQQLQRQHEEEQAESNVVYRRVLIPLNIETPTHESNPLIEHLNAAHDRQLEKMKDNKEAQNRNRQSQLSAASSGAEDSDHTIYNKSSHGKWKRRKGPAPALPIPPRKVLQMLPLQEIRHELDIIEVQQQGLEKQGVVLEKMIRDRCEDHNGDPIGGIVKISTVAADDSDGGGKPAVVTESLQNSKEVEDLILQLFELVNEKNELFRRQAELMYLRRQHRLEQEQADLEYEIRVLMAQPERNKTDTDKSREEALIARMVEVVQLRNEVVECLEMDRLREAEEDLSIKQRLELHSAKRASDDESKKTLSKLSKKEKKKQKEAKKLSKSKKIDADKDADETEMNADKQKKKKKKKFLF